MLYCCKRKGGSPHDIPIHLSHLRRPPVPIAGAVRLPGRPQLRPGQGGLREPPARQPPALQGPRRRQGDGRRPYPVLGRRLVFPPPGGPLCPDPPPLPRRPAGRGLWGGLVHRRPGPDRGRRRRARGGDRPVQALGEKGGQAVPPGGIRRGLGLPPASGRRRRGRAHRLLLPPGGGGVLQSVEAGRKIPLRSPRPPAPVGAEGGLVPLSLRK